MRGIGIAAGVAALLTTLPAEARSTRSAVAAGDAYVSMGSSFAAGAGIGPFQPGAGHGLHSGGHHA